MCEMYQSKQMVQVTSQSLLEFQVLRPKNTYVSFIRMASLIKILMWMLLFCKHFDTRMKLKRFLVVLSILAPSVAQITSISNIHC